MNTLFSHTETRYSTHKNANLRHGESVKNLAFEFDGAPYNFNGIVEGTTKFITGSAAENFIGNMLKSQELGIPLHVYDSGKTEVGAIRWCKLR